MWHFIQYTSTFLNLFCYYIEEHFFKCIRCNVHFSSALAVTYEPIIFQVIKI